jgi:hypothetical protein
MSPQTNIEQMIEITVERWVLPYSYEERSLFLASSNELLAAIRNLETEERASVHLEIDDRYLIIDISAARFAVWLQLAEGEYFNKVGDADATDTIPFVRGGQLIDWPSRYLVSLNEALDAAQEFFNTHTIRIADKGWEKA